MKKIKLTHDLNIPGYGPLKAGQQFKVIRYNSRFVYVMLGKCELRLSHKSDCEKVY